MATNFQRRTFSLEPSRWKTEILEYEEAEIAVWYRKNQGGQALEIAGYKIGEEYKDGFDREVANVVAVAETDREVLAEWISGETEADWISGERGSDYEVNFWD
jgi:hypothetical protein